MQKLLVALVAVVVVVAAATVYLLDDEPDRAPEVAARPEIAPAPEEPEPAPAPAAVSRPAQPQATPERQSVEAEPPAEAEADDEEREPLPTLAPAESRVVDVTVRVPAGSPGDETLVVLGLDGPKSWRDLYGPRGIAPERARLGRDTTYNGLVAVAKVDASGRARLTLPADLETPHVALSGRYLYNEGSIAIEQGVAAVELKADLGAWVTGHLIAPPVTSGTWKEEVEVRLRTDLEALTSLDGRRKIAFEQDRAPGDAYEFRAVPVAQTFMIGYRSEELAQQWTEGLSAEAGEHVEHDLQLVEGGRVTGRVVDDTGKPVAAATVQAKGREFYGNLAFELREAETGNDGTYSLDAVTPGEVWITVDHDEYLDARASTAIAVRDGESHVAPDLTLRLGGVVTGVVMFTDGTPAVGAKIELEPDLSANVQGVGIRPETFAGAGDEVFADEEGRFRLVGLGTGPFELVAEKVVEEEEKTAGRWSARLRPIAPEDANPQELHVVLDAPIHVSGRVVDAGDVPVTGFTITAERAATQWYLPPSETRFETFESETGEFTLTDLSTGTWTVRARAEGFVVSEPVELELPADEETELELRLLHPIHIAGVVIDPDGAPVSGALVGPELDLVQTVARQQGREVGVAEATTGGNGTFRLDDLAPGRGTVYASRDGWARSAGLTYDLEANETLDGVTLKLRHGGTITGEVMGEDGNGVAGAQVHIQRPGGPTGRRSTITDDRGYFEAHHLEPGTWQVSTFSSDSGGEFDYSELLSTLKMARVDLADEGEEHVRLGAQPDNPVLVRGEITASGEALGGGVISFVPAEGRGLESMKIQTIDEDGSYQVKLLAPGEYLVTIQRNVETGLQNSIEHRRLVPDVDEHRLDFELPVGRITGRVVGPSGEPLANLRVTLNVGGGSEFGTLFGGQYTETKTDNAGTYELNNLRPGAYRVAAGGSMLGGMFGDKALGGRKVARVDVREGQWVRGIDFRLDAPGGIRGLVVDHAGKPVEGAAVFIRDEGGNLMDVFSMTETDSGGNFAVKGLAPGEYTMTARSEPLASAEDAPIRVEGGSVVDVRLMMEPGTMLVVGLEDKSGKLVPARISVVDGLGREMTGMVALDDLMRMFTEGVDIEEQRVGPLPPGTYTVRAVAADERNAKKVVTLTGQDKRKVRLRLD